jgi:hypothetical protein
MSTEWIKATKSGSSGECVEMRRLGGRVEVRDSKDPGGPVQPLERDAFDTWLQGAKRGEFDGLLHG